MFKEYSHESFMQQLQSYPEEAREFLELFGGSSGLVAAYAEWEQRKLRAVNQLPGRDAGFYVVPDIQPYQSQIDGTMITSRSKHRKHLIEHGCIEVGNEIPKPQAPKRIGKAWKQEIIDVMNGKGRKHG